MKDPLLNLDPPKRVQGIGFRTKKTTVTLTGPPIGESRDRHRRLRYLLTPRVVFPVPRPRQNKTIPSRSTPLTSVHY